MSTRGTTYYDDDSGIEWTPLPKVWCAECCAPSCGCPNGERLENLRAQHYDGMGTE